MQAVELLGSLFTFCIIHRLCTIPSGTRVSGLLRDYQAIWEAVLSELHVLSRLRPQHLPHVKMGAFSPGRFN